MAHKPYVEVKRATLFLNCGRGVAPDSAVGEGGAVSWRQCQAGEWTGDGDGTDEHNIGEEQRVRPRPVIK